MEEGDYCDDEESGNATLCRWILNYRKSINKLKSASQVAYIGPQWVCLYTPRDTVMSCSSLLIEKSLKWVDKIFFPPRRSNSEVLPTTFNGKKTRKQKKSNQEN